VTALAGDASLILVIRATRKPRPLLHCARLELECVNIPPLSGSPSINLSEFGTLKDHVQVRYPHTVIFLHRSLAASPQHRGDAYICLCQLSHGVENRSSGAQ